MSSICGIIDFEKNSADFSILREMGRATLMRGGDQSGAYINGGVSLMCNRVIGDEDEEARQPFCVSANGKNYTVMLDGEIKGAARSGAETALEYYLSFGRECFSKFDGDFALCICDEYRGEIVLARSRGSTKPLYCSFSDGRLVFCSEPKGMFRAIKGPLRVDERILRDHIFSPAGKYSAGDIYLDIDELGEGQCAVFSKYYSSIYPCVSERVISDTAEEIVTLENWEPSDLRTCLGEALYAFDYPQFDMYMPMLANTLRTAARMNKKTLRISEGGVRYPDRYLKERCDRLGVLYGVSFRSTPCDGGAERKGEFKQLDKALQELLYEGDIPLLERIFGDGIAECVRQERALEARIRMTGMLIQTASLVKLYALLLCSENGIRDAYASRLSTM